MIWVYVIEHGDTGYCKIGISTNLPRRLAHLQSGTPFVLSLAYEMEFADRDRAFAVERGAHQRMTGFRARGEWFFCDPQDAIAAIEAVAKEVLVQA